MVWSSWSQQGYAVGIAVSNNGSIHGNWRHLEKTLFPGNGGHGMLFSTYEGQLKYILHYPNDRFMERPFPMDLDVNQDGILEIISPLS